MIYRVVFVLALLTGVVYALVLDQPGYTDAYYYFNAGQRLADGEGLTDPYLWIYLNAPDDLPAPSHTYWMPLQSLLAAAAMVPFGSTFRAAQIPSVLCFAGLVTLAFWIGEHLGGSRRRAWLAALLVMFGGFFTPFWTTTDTFALYGLVGAGALAAMGLGRASGSGRWYALAGGLSGLAHLARADGLLLVMVLVMVALWPHGGLFRRSGEQSRRISGAQLRAAGIGVLVYLLVMLPWFVRNMAVIDAPLPSGGMQTIWLRGYNELVNYPPGASASAFLDWGWDNILQSRRDALRTNLGTFIAVETWVILGPFVLAGLWRRRAEPFLLGVMLYALGLHLAMTFVFAYPGYRGGLFHSSAALLPFWASASVLGLDAAVEWAARKRRWRKPQARRVFSTALIVLAVVLSAGMFARQLDNWRDSDEFYNMVVSNLPPDAVLMVNDPTALYYHTGHWGVVVPNADPDVIPEIAARYSVTHLVLDINRTNPFTPLFLGKESRPFLCGPESSGCYYAHYGQATATRSDDQRVFEIVLSEQDE
jgi:hypothetical protein